MSQTLPKSECGCSIVSLSLVPDLAAYAESQWRGQGFADVRAYLNCVLNTALFFEKEADPPPPVAWPFDEQDDDIPF